MIDRVVGDSPELMPLDTSMNQDLHLSVMMHVIGTPRLGKDDPWRSRMDAPRLGMKSHLRTWDCDEDEEGWRQHPSSSERIVPQHLAGVDKF